MGSVTAKPIPGSSAKWCGPWWVIVSRVGFISGAQRPKRLYDLVFGDCVVHVYWLGCVWQAVFVLDNPHWLQPLGLSWAHILSSILEVYKVRNSKNTVKRKGPWLVWLSG